MLPDYIIYDELKREREEDGERPRIEVPTPPSDSEFDRPETPESDKDSDERRDDHNPDRGVTIISI